MGLVIPFESMEMDKDICEAMNIKPQRTSLEAMDELEGSYETEEWGLSNVMRQKSKAL